MSVIEILVYTLKPRRGRAFYSIMKEISVPLHRKNGIDVVWHGSSLHDVDCYFLIRRFSDLPGLEITQEAFYNSDAWRDGPREKIIEMIDTSIKVVVPMPDEIIDLIRKNGYNLKTEDLC